MAQASDYTVNNSTGANVRQDINTIFEAIATNNSGGSAPNNTKPTQFFADTTTSMLKLRNTSNNGYVNFRKLDGSLPLPDGSASSPSLFFDDDTNTGIFSGGADEINISTGGEERFVINSSGNCGIGIESPARILHLHESSSETCQLHITNSATGTTGNDGISFALGSDESLIINQRESNVITLKTADQARMTINSSGSVGIGTDNPSAKLDVNGDAIINSINVGKGTNSVAGNTVLGEDALDDAVSGGNNTAIGKQALTANTSGQFNIAVGGSCLDANTTGDQNTAIGFGALSDSQTSDNNTAVGSNALNGNTAGNNTAVGKDALKLNTSGQNNTAVGIEAGVDVSSGDRNVFLGAEAGKDQVNTASNQLYIARANTAASNIATWIYGDQHGRCFMGANDANWHTTSDQRLKKDIVDNTKGLEIINQIKVRNFKYKQYSNGSPVSLDDTVDINEFSSADNVNQVLIQQGVTGVQLGCIAQELETVLPNAVKTGEKGVKTVVTDELFWHMLNAIKELSAKVEALETA